jgi:transcription initiation factor TFIID TATA-box-binding protein
VHKDANSIRITVKLPTPLDIGDLHQKIKGTVKDPKVHWLKYRIPKNNFYIAFYLSGKFQVTAKSMEQIDQNVRYILARLEKIGITTTSWTLEIHNIVVGDSLYFPCPVEKLVANMDAKKASFEPEQSLH